jgi:hypothetical protein
MNFPFLDELNAAKSVLIVGAGGGYDVFCGLPLLIALKKAGKEVHLANISFGALNSCDGENPIAGLWKITQQTAATKYFPEMHLATWLARNFVEAPIYAIAPAGARPITAAFRWLCETLRFDTLILVDGGTDILMRGDEAGLATPEADAVSLFAGNELNEVARRFVACIGFGIDAHHGVCHAHFLENVATLSVENGYLGAWSLLNDSENSNFIATPTSTPSRASSNRASSIRASSQRSAATSATSIRPLAPRDRLYSSIHLWDSIGPFACKTSLATTCISIAFATQKHRTKSLWKSKSFANRCR